MKTKNCIQVDTTNETPITTNKEIKKIKIDIDLSIGHKQQSTLYGDDSGIQTIFHFYHEQISIHVINWMNACV